MVWYYTKGLPIHNTFFFYRKPGFDVKFLSFIVKTVFLTIQTDCRYIILFSSIENLVFDVKFQYFLEKTVFFNYTTGFSICNSIFFYRKTSFFDITFQCFPCQKRCFFTIQNGLSFTLYYFLL